MVSCGNYLDYLTFGYFWSVAGTMVDSLHSVFVFMFVFNNSLMLGGVTAEGRSPEDGMSLFYAFGMTRLRLRGDLY